MKGLFKTKKIDFKHVPLSRLILVGVIGLVALVMALSLFSLSMKSMTGRLTLFDGQSGGYSEDIAYEGKSSPSIGMGMSVSSIAPMPPLYRENQVIGNNAEQYEVSEYGVLIRSAHFAQTCDDIESWRSSDVITFQSRERSVHSCSFRFKVARAELDSVLGLLKAMNPESLTVRTESIQERLQSYDQEKTILNDRLTSIEKTLSESEDYFAQLMKLATQSQDAEALAQIIESRIMQMERLNAERSNIQAEIARLEKARSEEQDQIGYAFFSVNVLDYNLVDGPAIREAWITYMQDFIRVLNSVVAGLTLGLIGYLLKVVQLVVYVIIIVVLAKTGYRLFKKFWKS